MNPLASRGGLRALPFRQASPLVQAALAGALPCIAFLLCEVFSAALLPAFEPPFIAAVALASWFGGLYCGFGAAGISSLLVAYFFIPPVGSMAIDSATGWTRLIAFSGTNVLITVLIHSIYRARIEVRAAEARFRSASDLIPFGVWRADSAGNMIELSESFLTAFGTSMARCAGLGWTELIVPEERAEVIAAWRECTGNCDFWDHEYHMTAKDGSTVTVLSRGVPVRAGLGPNSWIGIHLDVTDREKAAEQRLEHERDIARFNTELDQFAYVASHDLQEPLRMIASYLQLLARRYRDNLDDEANTFIGYSVEGANRLQTLLQGMQLLSVIGKQPGRRKPIALAALVEAAKANLRDKIERAQSRIECAGLPTVVCDRFEMTQLFEHLFDNSLKFTAPGAAAQIKVTAVRQDTRFWHIVVSDDGIGIEAQYASQIFNLFQRLHSREEFPGTGIGLTICKKVVEVHGGRIWAEPGVGRGATIHFTLPA